MPDPAFPVIIYGTKILFSTTIVQSNDLTHRVGYGSLMTDYGFVAPVNADSMDVIDYLENGFDESALFDRVAKAILVNHRGHVYEVLCARMPDANKEHRGEDLLTKRRVLVGPDTRYVYSTSFQSIENVDTMLKLTNSLDEFLVFFKKEYYLRGHDYQVEDIRDMAMALASLKKDKPFPRLYTRKEPPA